MILAWVFGVCVWVRVYGFHPPILAGMLRCVCLCARSACIPPVLAAVFGVGWCAWVLVFAAPHHSWLRYWGVCVCVSAPPVPRQSWLGCAVWVSQLAFLLPARQCLLGWWHVCVFVTLCLYPAIPGSGVRCGCVCLGSGFSSAPTFLAGAVGVCVFVCPLRLYAANPRWGLWCVRWGSGLGFRAASPACAVGVCVFVCAPRLLPASPGSGAWLGSVLAFRFRLWPAIPGWDIGVCVLVCALCLQPANPGLGLRCVGWVLPGTFSHAVVLCVVGAPPGFAAPSGRYCLAHVPVPWLGPPACLSAVPRGPAWCAAPGLVRSLSVHRSAFSLPWCLPLPGAFARGNTGRLRGTPGGGARTGLVVPAPGPCRGRGPGLTLCRTRSGPCDGVVPGRSLRRRSWAECAAQVWRFWTRSLTCPVFRTVGLSTQASAGAPGLFRVDADTLPIWVGGRLPRVPCLCACVCSSGRGRAGRPPGRVLVRLSFPVAVILACVVSSAASGLGLPCFCLFPPFVLSFVFFSPLLSLAFLLSFALGPVCLPPLSFFEIFPFFLFVLFPCCFLAVHFSFRVCLSRCSSFVPLLLPPPPGAVWLFASSCFFRMLYVVFWGEAAAPRPCCAVLFILVPRVFLLRCAFWRRWCRPRPPPHLLPWWFVVFFVPTALFVLFICVFRFLVVSCTRLWCCPFCGVCAPVLCRAPVLVLCCLVQWFVVWSRCLQSCVVACCAVFSWLCVVPVYRAICCRAALRCCPLCVVPLCAGPFLCPAVWCHCVLLCCSVVLCCYAWCSFPRRFPMPVGGGLNLSRVVVSCAVVCLPSLCCVVHFVAVFMLFVALFPVLERRP